MVLIRIYLALSRLYPERMKQTLHRSLIHGGIEEEQDIWAGRAITTTLLFSLVAFIAPLVFLKSEPMLQAGLGAMTVQEAVLYISLPLFILSAALIAFLYYVYLFYRMQNRTDAIEKVLPDFLLIVVSNLHAGMSPYAAFVSAARPEFGPLEEEIKKVSALASSSQSLTFALMELSGRVNSVVFQKMILFFEKAVRSGGQMAKILHASAEEIRHIQEMREELLSQTRSYIIFLGFVIMIIAPLLLSISGQFIGMFLKIKAQTVGSGSASFDIPIFKGEVTVTPAFVDYLGFAFLVLASLLISFFMGSLMRGKLLYWIKYFPLIAAGSVVMFLISKSLVSGLLSAYG